MSGTPCFVGSRVPIQHLWDHLDGSSIEEFLEGFEGVSREQVLALLPTVEPGRVYFVLADDKDGPKP